jgi:phosphoribosylanthranilate isomerase
MTKIKICGLSRPMDIEFVNLAMPDYIGFVFAKSKRQVSEEKAWELKSALDPAIKAVGVFVNEEIDKIARLCRENIIDLVQLHGDEDMEYMKELKKQIHLPVIKAARVRSVEDIVQADRLNSDYLLLDAYREGQYGGCGEAFDWKMIEKVGKPYFLAGGIHTDNVVSALTQVRPYAVDVSSGVETDGVKDKKKIIDIITKVRSVKI